MAKRGRSMSLDKLVSQLSALDSQRKTLVSKLRMAVAAWSGDNPFPRKASTTGRSSRGRKKVAHGRGRKRRKMSAAARAKISAAQRARWATQKAGATKK
jgi:hypothetical protein